MGRKADLFAPISSCDLVMMTKQQGCILFVDYLLRYSWAHRAVSGLVGQVTRVRTMRLNFGTVRTRENVLLSFGPNDVSLVLAFCENGVSIFDGVEIEFARTIVGTGASIGANATIICGNSVGAYSLVGAGAVMTHDVPKYVGGWQPRQVPLLGLGDGREA